MTQRSYRIAYRYWRAWARLCCLIKAFRDLTHPEPAYALCERTQPPLWRQRRLRRQHLGRRKVNITQGWG